MDVTSFPGGRRRRRPGFTLLELSVSTLLVGVLMVASLRCVGAVARGRALSAHTEVADVLASELMSEILRTRYEDTLLPTFGPELSEVLNVVIRTRAMIDDVDDYKDWSETPPEAVDGTKRTELAGWQRAVTVNWVNPANPTQTSNVETGCKRVVVTVSRNGKILSRSTAVRNRDFKAAASNR